MFGFYTFKQRYFQQIDELTRAEKNFIIFFFGFRTGFRPTNGGRLIRLVRRGMRTGQTLFLQGIEPGISRVRPWKELLVTGAQATWLEFHKFYFVAISVHLPNL